jgi:hypothetical protein
MISRFEFSYARSDCLYCTSAVRHEDTPIRGRDASLCNKQIMIVQG